LRSTSVDAGRFTVDEIEVLAAEFLASDLVVRLTPATAVAQRRPPEWSTVEHRNLEDQVLAQLHALQRRHDAGLDRSAMLDALARSPVGLGEDQADAVTALCAPGPAVRLVLAPPGHGKTALTATSATAVRTSGRPVVALAATNKSVSELRDAGLDAVTIARFRHNGSRLGPGTVVILDEVSQVSTRDAHAIFDAVRRTPTAMVWCVGDEQQGQPVPPGGLAAELARQGRAGDVQAAELTVNRRQEHPAEQAALDRYRSGDVAGSQTIRTDHGWEHRHGTPAAARDALAVAAVADADGYGPEHVAVLAVSHADCEDLADRIRAIRTARGQLRGPALEGPGWGPTPRRYAAGDRILLHANIDLDGDRIPNGTTATVVAVHRSGLIACTDHGVRLSLPADVVGGAQPDRTPNLSHAWARTIAGAQGGTWEQVHLLATPTLDRHSAYVGQSRGRQPTHTWNTTSDDTYEHGHPIRDPRDPAAQTLDAMQRHPDTRFAAFNDPWVLDRELRAQRAAHERALAAEPPDVSDDLDRALQRRDHAERICRDLQHRLQQLDHTVADTGGLRTFRPSLRRQHHTALAARDTVERDLTTHRTELAAAQLTTATLQIQAEQRQHWQHANAWRHHEISRINQQLSDHWTAAVVGVIRQHDPLAYGLPHLRQSRRVLTVRATLDPGDHTAARDLQLVNDTLTELRIDRVTAIARTADAPAHLTAQLGPLPPPGPRRDAWCGLALTIEEQADRGIHHDTRQGRLDRDLQRVINRRGIDPLEHPHAIIDIADRIALTSDGATCELQRWQQAVQQATRVLEHQPQRTLELDRSLGLSL
jgi:AAA domain